MVFALLAFGLFACGETKKKLTYYDLKEAEKSLFNADQSLNEAVAPEVAEIRPNSLRCNRTSRPSTR